MPEMAQSNEINPTNNEGNREKSNTTSKTSPPWIQNILSFVGDLGAKYLTYRQYTNNVAIVNNAGDILRAPNISTDQRMSNFVEFSKANNTILTDDCMLKKCGTRLTDIVDVTKGMSSDTAENFRSNMLQGLVDLKRTMADNFVYLSAVVSVGLVVVQVWQLVEVWQEIKKAENLHKDETKFREIEKNIEEFKKICERLNESIHNVQADDIIVDLLELSETYTETLESISDLKAEINGVMQRLDLARKSQMHSGIFNTLMTVSSVVQLIAWSKYLSSPAKFIGGAIISTFTGLVIANAVTYRVTEKRIEELQTDISRLEKHAVEFKKIYSDIKTVLKDRRSN